MALAKSESAETPRPQLSLFDCVCVIVGIIIGSGIYKTSPLITSQTSGVSKWLLESNLLPAFLSDEQWIPLAILVGTWLLGAGIALCGALCYAELATAYPHHGGDYVYLKRAFGPQTGFFFVWCEFWIVRPANIGAVGFVFSEYFLRLLELDGNPLRTTVVTLLVVVTLTALNMWGVRSGIRTQNTLSVIKVAGLLLVFLVAFMLPAREGFDVQPFDVQSAGGSYALAIVMIMFTLGGWNDLAFISGEVKNPRRNLLWALVLGLACVTTTYILVTLAFVHGLGFQGVVQANEVASDLLQSRLGGIGSRLISGLICVSTLGAINGMLYAGARIYYALGKEHASFGWVGVWNPKWGGPVRGLWAQTLITLGLVLGFGLYQDGFSRLVNFSTLFFWGFFFLVGLSLFVLRRKEPDVPRPYKVFGYPFVPILFCLSSIYVLYSSTNYALSVGGWEWAWAALIVFGGLWVAAVVPPPATDLGTGREDPSATESISKGPSSLKASGDRLRRVGVSLGRVGLLVSLLGTLCAMTARWWWPGELASNFPLHYLMIAAMSALLLVLCRFPWLSLVPVAIVLINGSWIAASQSTPSLPSSNADSNVTIASLNLLQSNTRHDEVLAQIRSLDADMVVCVEVTPQWAEALAQLKDEYRFQELVPQEDAFGVAVLSRQPIATRQFQGPGNGPIQLLVRVPARDDQAWYVGATHVIPPGSPAAASQRDDQLGQWSQELLDQDAPAVLIGDLNVTPWSPIFRDLTRSGDWIDSRRGHGYQSTWPARLGALGIPIDHALVTPEVVVKSRTTFAIPGSDHRGIRLELQVNETATPATP